MRRTPILVLVAAVGLVLAACGEATEKLTEEAIEQSAGGGEVDIDEDGSVSIENDEGSFSVDEEGNVDIESEDGSFSIDGQSGELPDDFPDVPLPDDLQVQASSTQSDGDRTTYTVTATVEADPADLLEEMIARYESEGYEVEHQHDSTSGDDFTGGATFSDGDRLVSLTVLSDGDVGTALNISVQPAEQ